MKAPFYLKFEWSGEPTELDKKGCDGMYIKSFSPMKWYHWLFFILFNFKVIIKNLIKHNKNL